MSPRSSSFTNFKQRISEAREVLKWARDLADNVLSGAVAYILSSNIHRRHMTKGQRPMAVAMIYPPEPEKGGRGNKAREQTLRKPQGFLTADLPKLASSCVGQWARTAKNLYLITHYFRVHRPSRTAAGHA